MQSTIRVSVEPSRLVADNNALTVFVIDDKGNRFPCATRQDIAALAPLYVRGNSANGRVLGEAHRALVRLQMEDKPMRWVYTVVANVEPDGSYHTLDVTEPVAAGTEDELKAVAHAAAFLAAVEQGLTRNAYNAVLYRTPAGEIPHGVKRVELARAGRF